MSLPRQVLPGTTYLLTRRCIGRRFLLRPDAELNNLFVYCLTLAAQKHGVEVHAVVVMSNHYHIVLTDVRGELPLFVHWLNRVTSHCIKRLRRWDEVVWEPHIAYSAVSLPGRAEVLDKLSYCILNPVSAALVRNPAQWPGVITTSETLRTGSMNAHRPTVWFKDSSPEEVTLKLSPPPCFKDERPKYIAVLQRLVERRLTNLRANFRKEGRGFVGPSRVLKQRVTDKPSERKQRFGRRPTFSALTRSGYVRAVKRLRAFRTTYRQAYEAWRNGQANVEFPMGTWWVVRYACATAVS